MWPRVVEVTLGCWLLVAPFVFRDTPAIDSYSTNAIASGALVVVASLLSFWSRLRLAHLVTLGVALWLALHGYFSAPRPGPPAAQNELALGLTLLLFAILPNEINAVPRPWRETTSSAAARRRPQ
jgi:hypothetical protein